MVLDGLGLDHAGVVDHRLQEGVPGIGGEEDGAAVGLDQAAVLGQSVQSGVTDLEVQQAVAGERQRDGAAGAEGGGSAGGGEGAVVDDLAAEEGHIAAGGGGDGAVVDHGGMARAAENVVPGEEGGVADVQGGGDQTPHVDLRPRGEGDSVGVDQEDLAVGVQVSVDGAWITPQYAIQGDAVDIRLVEGDGLLAADPEALPVEDGLGRRLGDSERAAALPEACLAGYHLAAGREREGHRRGTAQGAEGGTDQGRERPAAAAGGRTARLAAGSGDLGGGHEGIQGAVPDEAVDVVHGDTPSQ